jgi:hypothetical protein
MPRQSRDVLWVVLGQLALVHCGSRAERAAPPSAAAPTNLVAAPRPAVAEASAAHRPPSIPFVAPQAWHSKRADQAPVAPPDLGLETWRALVTQNQPLQVQTPLWQPLAAEQTVELTMPAGSRFRCVVTPLQVKAGANPFGTKLKYWSLARSLLCSPDGFRSWTEYPYSGHLMADGSRDLPAKSIAWLREWDADQHERQTFVIMRSDKENREATTGPPRIVTNVPLEED